MYEGLLLLLIDRCQGELKRYEIILLILKEYTQLKREEVQFLFSLLDNEKALDDEAYRLITKAKSDFPYLESEISYFELDVRLNRTPTQDEVDLLEGMLPFLLTF
jgi:hypothetical protein